MVITCTFFLLFRVCDTAFFSCLILLSLCVFCSLFREREAKDKEWEKKKADRKAEEKKEKRRREEEGDGDDQVCWGVSRATGACWQGGGVG